MAKMATNVVRVLSLIALIAVVSFSLASSLVTAQSAKSEVRGAELAAVVEITGKEAKAEGRLFLPEKVGRVHAVIVDVTTVVNQSITEFVCGDPQWRALAGTLRSGLFCLTIRSNSPTPADTPVADQLMRNASLGGAEGLLALLHRFAGESGHRELEDAPLLLWGISRTGSFAITFAALHPQRTIGLVRYHSHRRGLPADMNVVTKIPALHIASTKDETAGVEDIQDLWRDGRSVGAPWTFAVEQDAPHVSLEALKKANDLMILWVAAVVRLRVPSRGALRTV